MNNRTNIYWSEIASCKEAELNISFFLESHPQGSYFWYTTKGVCYDASDFKYFHRYISTSVEESQIRIDENHPATMIIHIQGTLERRSIDLVCATHEEFSKFLFDNVLILTPEAQAQKQELDELNARLERLESETTLISLVKHNLLDEIMKLLAKDENTEIDKPDCEGNTPLHYAAHFGLTKVLHELQKKGANPNIKNTKGNTPLMVAVMNLHPNAAKCLEENKNIDITIKNNDGHTASWYARRSRHPDLTNLAERLLELEPTQSTSKSPFASRLQAIHFLDKLNKDFYCPISGKLIENPVTLANGQTYDLEPLQLYFHEHANPPLLPCPRTGKLIYLTNITNVKTNYVIKNQIDESITRKEKHYHQAKLTLFNESNIHSNSVSAQSDKNGIRTKSY